VLATSSSVAVTRGPNGCTVLSGWWVSLYDNYSTPDPGELHIDHVVALAEAWRSGAWSWTSEQRRLYYDNQANLLAVTASTNLSKSDRGPESWQPPNRAGWCEYTRIYIRTKATWSLSVDPAEYQALSNMRAGC